MSSGSGLAGRVTGRRDAKAQGKATEAGVVGVRPGGPAAGDAEPPAGAPARTAHGHRGMPGLLRGMSGRKALGASSVRPRAAVPEDLIAAQRANARVVGPHGAVGKAPDTGASAARDGTTR